MLDVIHFYMDDDLLSVTSGEHLDAKQKARSILFKGIYGRDITIFGEDQEATSPIDEYGPPLEESISPFNPSAGPTKPFVPSTNFDPQSTKPFGDILDSPLG